MSSDIKKQLAEAIIENAGTNEEDKSEEIQHPTVNINSNGDNNTMITGNNNTIITIPRYIKKTIVKTKPGTTHITEKQCFILGEMVREIIELENLTKEEPCSYQKVWGALNRKMEVRSYRLIPYEKFDDALKYLRTWKGRLTSTPAARKKNPKWRYKQYCLIKPVTKKLRMEDRLDALLSEQYSVTSIKDLSDDDLTKVTRTVCSWQTAAEKQNNRNHP